MHVDPGVGRELGAADDRHGLVAGKALLELGLGVEGIGPPDRGALLRGDYKRLAVLSFEKRKFSPSAFLHVLNWRSNGVKKAGIGV